MQRHVVHFMLGLLIATLAQMTFWCSICSSAIGTSLWFDGEDDAEDHRRSQLHKIVVARSDPEGLKQFSLQLKKEKPQDKTGSEFSMLVQWKYCLFRQAQKIEERYRDEDARKNKVHFP